MSVEPLEERIVLAAPVLDPSASPELSAISEDAGVPTGSVGTLVSALIDAGGPLNNYSDADNDSPGIAITGVNLQGGTLWYSQDNGTTWQDVGTVSDAAPRLLVADTESRLYFQPADDFSGTISDVITFRAWDQQALQQLGLDIDGEEAGDVLGNSVSLSADGLTVAIGAAFNDGNGSNSGHVRVYQWDSVNSAWMQRGTDIDGEAAGDNSGYSVSLSADGQMVAIGARFNGGNGSESGQVRIYQWDSVNSAWVQQGTDIDGEAAGDRFGWSVSLSADGQTVAIGARYNGGNGSNSGHVRIYQWDSVNSAWVQQGADIDGEVAGDQSGYSVSLSADGQTVAIGARGNDGNGSNSGHVRIYQWDSVNSAWVQQGADIDGEVAGDSSGISVSLSADGQTVAIGAADSVAESGQVRIYRWDSVNSAWVQQGTDIDGEAAGDRLGWSVSLSADGQTVAIGATYNDGNGSNSGHVRIYQWDSVNSAWVQQGADIDGEAADDFSGHAVSLSGDGLIVAVGASGNDGNGSNSGHVRIYRLTPSVSVTTDTISVTVNAVNDAPTLDAIDDLTFLEDSGEQTVSLSGITAGGGESQSLRVTVSSDNTDLVPTPTLEYTSPDSSGILRLQPTPYKSGSATITVTVEDGGADGDLESASDNANFTRTFVVSVTPIRPVITSPGTKTDSQRPRLEWNAVPDAASYEIWIGNSSTGQNPYVQGTADTTYFDITQDLGIGKMDLWVRAKKGDGSFLPWTRMQRFKVTTPPDVADIAVRQETARPTVTWPAVPGATSYDLWVNNHSTGESQIFRQSLAEPTWTSPQDLPMSRYRLWTRAEGPDGFVGSWSIRTSFYTVPAPQAISPVLSTFDRTPAFDWSDVAGADSYGVFVRSLVDGTIAADIKDLPTSEWTPDTDLAPGLYVWQASADSSVAGFRSAWTPRQEFYVGGLPTITSPVSPAASTTPLIEWQEVTGAGHYILQVNGQVEGAKLIYRDDLTTSSFQVETPLASGGTYRVWVKAVSTTGEHGPWTDAYVFTVAASQIDQSQEALPNNVLALLDQNPLVTSREVVPERPVSRTVPDGRALAADYECAVETDVSVTPMDLREPAAEFVPDDNFAGGALLSRVLPRDWFEQVAEALEI